jgi:hypothetical protein
MTDHHPLSKEQEPELALGHGRGAGERPDVFLVVFLELLFQELEALRLTLSLLQLLSPPDK